MGANTLVVTDNTFEAEVLKSDVPVLVDFWAEWCAPCRALTPTIEEVATQFLGKVKFVKVNVDENPGITTQFGIRSIPTLILFKGGRQVDMTLGNIAKAQLVTLVQKAL